MWATILQTASVVIAAFSFTLGISAWRRTLLGQRRFDLAEQVDEGFANIKTALSEIRSPIGYAGEGQTRPQQGVEETPEQKQLLDQAFVAIERYKDRSEHFAKLRSLRHRFALYFGDDAAEPFQELEDIVGEIVLASRRLSRLWPRQGQPMDDAQFASHLENMHAAEAIFWEGSEEPDPLNPRIDKMVSDIHEACRAAINPSRNIYTVVGGWIHSFSSFFHCRS